jgi:PhnB protein
MLSTGRLAEEACMLVQPYLNFDGRCDEALEFYKKAIGAKVGMLMRFKDAPDQSMISPGSENKVMHSSFQVGETTIMASDGRCTGKANFHGIALSITANSEAEADKLFGGLAEGGQVNMPLSKTFFSPKFGMLSDKFGVGWMISVAH